MSVLEDVFGKIPSAVIRPVLALVGVIVDLVKAGDDPKAREEALMRAAETMKAELDHQRWGA